MGKCETCKNMEMIDNVPFSALEISQASSERHIKRLWIALIVSIALGISLVFASNAIWLWVWMQYDYTSECEEIVYQQDGEGTNIIGNSNEVESYGAESNG